MKPAWECVGAALVAEGFSATGGGKEDSFVGTLTSGRVAVDIELTVEDYNFLSMPRVRILNKDALPKSISAHLSEDDSLCYADRETFLLDRYQPDRSVLAVLERARETLGVLLHGNPTREIMAEFFAYWGGTPYAFIDPPLSLAEATLGVVNFKAGHVTRVAARSEDRLKSWAAAANATAEIQQSIAVIQCPEAVRPPSASIDTFEDALAWARSQPRISIDVAELATSNADPRPGLFLAGTNGIFGFLAVSDATLKAASRKGFRASSLPALWRSQASKLKIERLRGVAADHAEIVGRNLAGITPLSGKRIALIGCGTLGGHLARGLVQCGAGMDATFLLVDPDVFSPGNIGRHLLGVRHIGRNKAEALAEALRNDFPDVSIEAVPRSGATLMNRFAGYDLVIDATGMEQFSEALNAWALNGRTSRTAGLPIMYASLHGNGVAAQTFLDTGRPGDACFRCLRPAFDRPRRYPAVRPEYENPEVAVRPCGDGTFVPFAVDATMLTASLALRHGIDVLTGDGRPTLRTRVIELQKARHQNDCTPVRSDNCPACSHLISEPALSSPS